MILICRTHPQDIFHLENFYQVMRQVTFVTRSSADFQLGDYAKSTAEEDVWVAKQDNKIVGFVSAYSMGNFIHNLFVHPDHQRQGIGTQLLASAEAILKRPMTLKIAMDNLNVCAFYEKQGWQQVSVHEEDPEPFLLYRKI